MSPPRAWTQVGSLGALRSTASSPQQPSCKLSVAVHLYICTCGPSNSTAIKSTIGLAVPTQPACSPTPTPRLPAGARRALWGVIRGEMAAGRTVLLTSHRCSHWAGAWCVLLLSALQALLLLLLSWDGQCLQRSSQI